MHADDDGPTWNIDAGLPMFTEIGDCMECTEQVLNDSTLWANPIWVNFFDHTCVHAPIHVKNN